MDTDLPPSIRRLIDYGIQTVAPDRVILFGSRARGDAREDSDFDLAFDFLPERQLYWLLLLPQLPTFPLLSCLWVSPPGPNRLPNSKRAFAAMELSYMNDPTIYNLVEIYGFSSFEH